jgi:hypothetical protein
VLFAAQALQAPAAKSSFSYGTVNNPTILNNGHTLQVPLPADFKSDVKIPVKGEDAFCCSSWLKKEGVSFWYM